MLKDFFEIISSVISLCANGLKEGVAIVSAFFGSVVKVSPFLPSVIITAFGCAIAFKVVMKVI